jgi:hypothetical protein
VNALQQADAVYSSRVRAVYATLAVFLAQARDNAGAAQIDSVRAAGTRYRKIFWEQPEIADSLLTPIQRELMPILKALLSVPLQGRQQMDFNFGPPVGPVGPT